MIRIALIITLLTISQNCFSQYSFSRVYDIPVNDGNNSLERAWEGGLNYPIFSNTDYDNDGEMDLVGFDKSGNRILLYNNDGLTFKPYPNDLLLERWVLFRDFNCDGLDDIFTGTSTGIRVYRNTGNFEFTLEKQILKSQYNSFVSNLYVGNSDIPGIVDIDGDGDLDILTFEINGVSVEWHKNLSMETTSDCSQLTFEVSANCWGKFQENATTSAILLNQACGPTPPPDQRKPERHAGSTITALDQNYDGDIDLLIGDISFNDMVYLNNGGSPTSALMDSKNESFPAYNNSINIHIFPYASYADVDFDGKSDLIVVSNDPTVGNNKEVIHYQNTGINQDTFAFETNAFLLDEMLDFGTCAYPVLLDENQDGLMDILVGSNGYNQNGTPLAQLALLRNTGTNKNPEFELINEDYLNLSSITERYLYPAVGDIDGDGDDDLFLGLMNGEIAYYNNTAGFGNPCSFVLANGSFESIDVGAFAAPQLIDLNNDNLLDFIVGKQQGTLTHFPNQGTANAPSFTFVEDDFGGITTQDFDQGAFFGYSTPHFFKDVDTIRALVGSEEGGIYYYKDISELLGGYVALTSKNFANTKDGGRSSIITHNLNDDQYMDLIIGNQSGGLAFHEGDQLNSAKEVVKNIKSLDYTNTGNKLIINDFIFCKIKLLSLTGQVVKQQNNLDNSISLQGISEGIYIGLLEQNGQLYSFKFVR